MILVLHVTLQDHVTKGSCEFMSRSPLKVMHHPAKFGGFWHCVSGCVMSPVCYVNLYDHVAKRSFKSTVRKITILPSLVTIGTVRVKI